MIHRHHIIPKHEWKSRFSTLSGFNDVDNVVYLTTEQHAHVHHLLYEINNKEEDYLAYKALSGQISISDASPQAISLGRFKLKGKKRTPQQKENIRLGHLGKRLSEATKRKISASRMGQINNKLGVVSEEQRRQLSEIGKTKIGKFNNFFGKKHSADSKKKISESKMVKRRDK